MITLSKIKEITLNFLFPPRCEFCSEIISWLTQPQLIVCQKCLSQISFIGIHACKYCGKLLRDDEINVCPQCTGKRYYSEILSSCEYKGLLRQKLLEFKFKGNKKLYKAFALFIIDKLKMTKLAGFDIIISVPMHLSKLEERGYNQSSLIAEEIARYFSITYSDNCIRKIKLTGMQSKLDKKSRSINVKGAFYVSNSQEIRGKRILLVDDIITTGATLNECSKVLMEAGAMEITALTVATGIID